MNEQEQKTADYLKLAFCIDGEAVLDKNINVDGKFGIMYKLTDSERGTFYIAMLTQL
jgi:hypothetical protein